MSENPPDSPSEGILRRNWGCALVVGTVLVVGGILMWWSVEDAREAARCANCAGTLKIIAGAMLNYHDKYGCFPPAYIADKDGRPMHSWRVLIMPFLENQEFIDRYRFDEPWNSPHNRALADGIPHGMNPNYPIYHCPSDRDSDKWDTSYVMVVGPRTISDGPTSTSREDFTDGISNTIMIVEMSESGIHWMEPRDLKFDEMSFRINDPDRRGIRSKHLGGVNIVLCNMNSRVVHENIDPEVLKGLLTRNGGDP
jgi:hypothetical protein